MEESYLLKRHGKYTLHEQNDMTAEERKWVLNRIKKQADEEKQEADKAASKR